MLAGHDQVRLASLPAELGASTLALDATNVRQVESCPKQAADLFGTVTGLANCVRSLLFKPAHLITAEEWDSTIAVNLKSAFAVACAAV